MMDLERLEEYTLTNEELQAEVARLKAEVGNLEVQISEYRQILAELTNHINNLTGKK